MKYFIKTFGCQQNVSDSERLGARFKSRGMTLARSYKDAQYVVINTCMVRERAENKVYGLVENLTKMKAARSKENPLKIIVTGCMVGAAFRDASGVFFKKIKKAMPGVDEFMPIEEVGFDFAPIRTSASAAWVPISNGCNNFCTFCIVPFTRGREISRPYEDIIRECRELRDTGYTEVTLLGQNVNSYGADLIAGPHAIHVLRDIQGKEYFSGESDVKHSKTFDSFTVCGREIHPVYVTHLGRKRIPTLFPFLLEEIAHMGFERVDFVSSNPWDFSDELIDVIARNENITRTIHLPVQHGDNTLLRKMNRWYTREEYIALVDKLKEKIPQVQFTTDIIVGFCGETEAHFEKLVSLCEEVGFYKAYIAMYSPRPMTAATKLMTDDVPHTVKRQRWKRLENLINKPHLASFNEAPHHMHKKAAYAQKGESN